MQTQAFQPVMFIGSLLLFAVVAIGMLLAPMVLGLLLRPRKPNPEKDAVYECGEPTIGSSNVQFDLRFYVVALLFIVFDVEVAFFYPWAVVYGKANTLANTTLGEDQRDLVSDQMLNQPKSPAITTDTARVIQKIALVDLLVFFVVILVGFAYVWRRGDLDWVRSVARQRALQQSMAGATPEPEANAPALSA